MPPAWVTSVVAPVATTLRSRHLLGIADMTPAEISLVLDTAVAMKEVGTRTVKKVPALRGKTVVNLFFEPSTRTRTSFEVAEKRLSADTLSIAVAQSSVTKGETLLDTVRNLEINAAWKFNEHWFADIGWSHRQSVGANRYEKYTLNLKDQPLPPTSACNSSAELLGVVVPPVAERQTFIVCHGLAFAPDGGRLAAAVPGGTGHRCGLAQRRGPPPRGGRGHAVRRGALDDQLGGLAGPRHRRFEPHNDGLGIGREAGGDQVRVDCRHPVDRVASGHREAGHVNLPVRDDSDALLRLHVAGMTPLDFVSEPDKEAMREQRLEPFGWERCREFAERVDADDPDETFAGAFSIQSAPGGVFRPVTDGEDGVTAVTEYLGRRAGREPVDGAAHHLVGAGHLLVGYTVLGVLVSRKQA